MEIIQLKTSDQYDISITLFEPKNSVQKLLLINSATGVKQQTYYDFAQYFADNGYTVITYDYRGISLSKPQKMKASFL
jgi:predicted alpha/beta hydrolase